MSPRFSRRYTLCARTLWLLGCCSGCQPGLIQTRHSRLSPWIPCSGQRFVDLRVSAGSSVERTAAARLLQGYQAEVQRAFVAAHGRACDPSLALRGSLLAASLVPNKQHLRGPRRARVVTELAAFEERTGRRLFRRQFVAERGCSSPAPPSGPWRCALAQLRPQLDRFAHRTLAALTSRPTSGPMLSTPRQAVAERPSASLIRHGSCVVVASQGLIATALHVVEGAREIAVRLAGGRTLAARVIHRESQQDVALLQVQAENLSSLPPARGESIRLGQRIFTIGFPAVHVLGDAPRFSEGSVSALVGPLGTKHLLQVSVPLQPGNSGGPIVSHSGELVGLVISAAEPQRFQQATGQLPQHVNFAVRADVLRRWIGPAHAESATDREAAIARTAAAVCAVAARVVEQPPG